MKIEKSAEILLLDNVTFVVTKQPRTHTSYLFQRLSVAVMLQTGAGTDMQFL